MNDAMYRFRSAVKGALLALAAVCAAWPVPVSAETAPEWQSLLERLVDINSGTRNVEGLDAVREVLIPEFEKLGLRADIHDLDDGHKLVAMAVPAATWTGQPGAAPTADTSISRACPSWMPILV